MKSILSRIAVCLGISGKKIPESSPFETPDYSEIVDRVEYVILEFPDKTWEITVPSDPRFIAMRNKELLDGC